MASTTTIPPHFKFKLWNYYPPPNTHLEVIAVRPRRSGRSSIVSFYSTHQHHLLHRTFNPKSSSIHRVLTRVTSDGGGIVDAASEQSASEVSSELFFLFMLTPLRSWGVVIPSFSGFYEWESGLRVVVIPCLLRKGLCSKGKFLVVILSIVDVDDAMSFYLKLAMPFSLRYGMGMERDIECSCCLEFPLLGCDHLPFEAFTSFGLIFMTLIEG